jgi:2-keto-4-pentenoate hydratase
LSKPEQGEGMIDALAELADRQWRDYRAREPGTCFADPGFVLDLPQAYDLQHAVATLRIAGGDRVIGYKVGCTGPGTVAQFGMEGPIRGYLYESEIRQTGDKLEMAAFAQLAIEGEMALRIGDHGQIAAAFPVIELHHFVFRAPRKTLVELVANNGLNAGVVLPAKAWLSSRTSLTKGAALSVSINGGMLGSGELWPLPGGPVASLDWLRHHLAEFKRALVPGQIVLAGTTLGLYPVKSSDHIAVFIDDEPVTQCSVA